MGKTKSIIGTATTLTGIVDLAIHLRTFPLPSVNPPKLDADMGAFLTTATGILATTGTNIASSEVLADAVDGLDSEYKRNVGRQAILSSSIGVKILSQAIVLYLYGFSTQDWESVKNYSGTVLVPSAGASALIALLAPNFVV